MGLLRSKLNLLKLRARVWSLTFIRWNTLDKQSMSARAKCQTYSAGPHSPHLTRLSSLKGTFQGIYISAQLNLLGPKADVFSLICCVSPFSLLSCPVSLSALSHRPMIACICVSLGVGALSAGNTGGDKAARGTRGHSVKDVISVSFVLPRSFALLAAGR